VTARRAALLGGLALVGAAAVTWVVDRADPAPPAAAVRGAHLFRTKFTPEQGLGPLFNETACSGCHLEPKVGGVGRNGLKTVLRVGRLGDAGFASMVGRGGPFAHEHAISELSEDCDRAAGIPAGANVTSVRNTPPLFGAGLIDAIPAEAITAGAAVARADGISGRPNLVRGPDGRRRVGRFGWKADVATLEGFVAAALRNELGVTSALAPAAPGPCESAQPEVDGDEVAALTAFIARLPAPRPRMADHGGAKVFREAGCAACHVPSLPAGGREARLYSDLLLHDMGRALDDRVVQGSAGGPDWRTTPLWGLSARTRYLHDGRADTLEAAILAHGGEAAAAQRRFRSLSAEQRDDLMAFLRSR
jgi:CxxC motif-containing protein (DUF1111 family)